jgi:hypothetical protein
MRNTAALAGSDDAQHGRSLPVAIAAEEAPVGPFRGAVVNLQLAVFEQTCQHIAHRGAGRALRRTSGLQFQPILVEFAEQPLAQCPPFAPPTLSGSSASSRWQRVAHDIGARPAGPSMRLSLFESLREVASLNARSACVCRIMVVGMPILVPALAACVTSHFPMSHGGTSWYQSNHSFSCA